MKGTRPASIAGAIAGAALSLLAAHVLPGCSTLPPYIGIGFHFTTTPPTPRPDVIAVPTPPTSTQGSPHP